MATTHDLLKRPRRNRTCPYCGSDLAAATANKEHVVGRRFVPTGSLDGSPNLIFRACEVCNNRKSDLEDDISAITMLPDAARSYGDRNVSVADEAVRKAARSRSRQTGKPVAQSSVTQTFEGFPLPGLKMSVTTVGPPQLDDERIFLLAQYQLSGFFYALTYDFAEDRGGFWPGGFFPITYAPRSDWSNPVQMWFMHRVLSWLPRAVGTFASGFFRIAIRRSPEADVWSWALEWNQNIRVIGFFGEEESALPIKGEMPELPMNVVGTLPGGGVLRMRSEVPLKEEDDVLFYAQELQDASERSTSSEGSVESNCGDESTLSEP